MKKYFLKNYMMILLVFALFCLLVGLGLCGIGLVESNYLAFWLGLLFSIGAPLLSVLIMQILLDIDIQSYYKLSNKGTI